MFPLGLVRLPAAWGQLRRRVGLTNLGDRILLLMPLSGSPGGINGLGYETTMGGGRQGGQCLGRGKMRIVFEFELFLALY